MTNPTLFVAILVSILVLVLRPSHALTAYLAALVWYPNDARVSVGTIDFSVGRIVITVLLLRCLCDERIWRKFAWSQLDTWIAVSMTVYVGIFCLTRPFEMAIENRAGFLMDTFLPYLVVRFIIKDKTTCVSFLKGAGIVIALLAVFGVVQSITYWNPYLLLIRFRPWNPIFDTIEMPSRWGLARASGPFSHPILFGACFVMFLPLIWVLRHENKNWSKLAYCLSGMVILGAFSSMSSGSWVMLIAIIFCLIMERFKRWIKPLFIGGVASCMAIGIISNRSIYHVLYDYANPAGGIWYQRADLIDSAIENIDEWWLVGYGGKEPGWGERFGTFTDTNNEFILMGILYGLLGIFVLCAVLISAFRGLMRASRQTLDPAGKSLYWSLGCVLVGVIVIWQGVSFFGQMPVLFYSILGIIGSSIGLAKSQALARSESLGMKGNKVILVRG